MPTLEKSARRGGPDVRVLGTVLGATIVFAFTTWAAWAFLELSVFPRLRSPWLIVIPLLAARKHVKRLGPVLVHVVRNVVADIRRPPLAQPVTFTCATCGVGYISPYYFRHTSTVCTECERRVASGRRDETPTA